MAPEGDQAFAQINNDIYVVTIPKTGGDVPENFCFRCRQRTVPTAQTYQAGRRVLKLEQQWKNRLLLFR